MITDPERTWYKTKAFQIIVGIIVICALEIMTGKSPLYIAGLVMFIVLIMAGIPLLMRFVPGSATGIFIGEPLSLKKQKESLETPVDREIVFNHDRSMVFDWCMDAFRQFSSHNICTVDPAAGIVTATVQTGIFHKESAVTITLTNPVKKRTLVSIHAVTAYPEVRSSQMVNAAVADRISSFLEMKSQVPYDSIPQTDFSTTTQHDWPLKSPFQAGVYSLIIPGLGQTYNGEVVKGAILLLLGTAGLWTVGMFAIIIWLAGMADGILTARKINTGVLPFTPQNEKILAVHLIIGLTIIGLSIAALAYFSMGGSVDKYINLLMK